jgi:aspartyl protease family protein
VPGLAFLLIAAAFLALGFGEARLAGLAPEELAALASVGALALLAANRIVDAFRAGLARGINSVLLWGLFVGALGGAYANRGAIEDGAVRVLGEFAQGRPVTGSGGEVVITRGGGGSFTVQGRINGRDARFVFDTGASAVVLTAETAKALGLEPAPDAYTVPIATANGRSTAAPTTLATLSVGEITERRIPAFVARPGALRDNLLGLSFLDRLTSYEVRGSRLILRGRGGTGA